MKRIICLLMALCMVFALAACESKPAENDQTPEPDTKTGEWTRNGYFMDEADNLLSVTWMELEEDAGWYVGCMLGDDMTEDSFGGMLEPDGNSLKGVLTSYGSRGDLTVTVTEEGEDGLVLAIDGGETYHFKEFDVPDATIFVTINTEGQGNIAYAEGEEPPEIDTEYPYQSAQINLAEPTVHTITAWPSAGSFFVKWTKNGEDFSEEPTITVNLDETADFVAVFESDPDWVNPVAKYEGRYQCDRVTAVIETLGADEALVNIEWPGSAWESAAWTFVSKFDTEKNQLDYEGCPKMNVTYNEDGEITDQQEEYTDGSGFLVFADDGSFVWYDNKADYDPMVFEWVAPLDNTEGNGVG